MEKHPAYYSCKLNSEKAFPGRHLLQESCNVVEGIWAITLQNFKNAMSD